MKKIFRIFLSLGLFAAASPFTSYANTQRVSVGSKGEEVVGDSSFASLSSDSHYVAFVSNAADLQGPFTSSGFQIFLKNIETGQVEPISTRNKVLGNQPSYLTSQSISASGYNIVFETLANNLTPDANNLSDTNNSSDIYWYSKYNGLRLVSSARCNGTQAADGQSDRAFLTKDGAGVLFTSTAKNMTLSPEPAFLPQVYLLSQNSSCPQPMTFFWIDGQSANGPSYSAGAGFDSTKLLIYSLGNNLVLHDNNQELDLFLTSSLNPRASIRISRTYDNGEAHGETGKSRNASISDDGCVVAFESSAHNLIPGGTTVGRQHVYVRDLCKGEISLLSKNNLGNEADADSSFPQISGNGTRVVFQSKAKNLSEKTLNAQSDASYVFAYDLRLGLLQMVSRSLTADLPNGKSQMPVIDGTGEWVAFSSDATNLVENDNNRSSDVFRVNVNDIFAEVVFEAKDHTTDPTVPLQYRKFVINENIRKQILATVWELKGSNVTTFERSPTHFYEPGSHKVTLHVRFEDSSDLVATKTINVTEQAKVAGGGWCMLSHQVPTHGTFVGMGITLFLLGLGILLWRKWMASAS